MKNALVFLASLVFAVGCYAQTAQVIQLTPDESRQAAALYAQKAEVEAKIAALQTSITEKYTKETRTYVFCTSCVTYLGTKTGWEGGFEYSTDFKFIVPAPQPTTFGASGCTYLNPAVNTFTAIPATPTTYTSPWSFTQETK